MAQPNANRPIIHPARLGIDRNNDNEAPQPANPPQPPAPQPPIPPQPPQPANNNNQGPPPPAQQPRNDNDQLRVLIQEATQGPLDNIGRQTDALAEAFRHTRT